MEVTCPTMDVVKLIECPRDAWQGLAQQIPTARKVEYLRALIAAGFRHLDAASFVSPKAVPQMADSEEVLVQLGPHHGVEIIGIVVNERGAERAIATGAVTTLGFPCSISETFLRRNQNQSQEENRAILRRIAERAEQAGLGMVVYVSMAFGNPYGDAWSAEKIALSVDAIAELGIPSISLADTVGKADARFVSEIVSSVIRQSTSSEIGVHLHSTRADAAGKILAAYGAGCRRFDSAIGGLGGCPFAQDDLVGNIPTEEVVRALATRGVDLPNALDSLVTLSNAIAQSF
ncbi:MAG: hydroxymethylglutaryl-CoA lyase [Verrucomicrobiota bacterium]|nr:hydroxymethylglutaryl-CoA lyase [Verrucomicrobiota bacterium]